MNFKHGMTGTSTHNAWLRMIDRCRNDRQGTYGKKGIQICPEWERSFEAFYRDMGDPPSPKHSLDRYPDTRGNYEPGNCRWATRIEQARNTTHNTVLTIDGVTATIAEWSEKTGIKEATICRRLSSGMSPVAALTVPVRPWRLNTPWNAEGISRSEWYRRRRQ